MDVDLAAAMNVAIDKGLRRYAWDRYEARMWKIAVCERGLKMDQLDRDQRLSVAWLLQDRLQNREAQIALPNIKEVP